MFLVGLGFGGSAKAQEDPSAKLQPKLDAAAMASRELARQLVPPATALGGGWKAPWELPKALSPTSESEAAYWDRQFYRLGPIGMSEGDSRVLAEFTVRELERKAVRDGKSLKDAMIRLISQSREHLLPPAQRFLEGLESSAEIARREKAATIENNLYSIRGKARRKITTEVLSEPYANFDRNAFVQVIARDIGLLERRMKMTYYRSNDWPGLVDVSMDEKKMRERGIWFMVVRLDLLLMMPNPLHWPPDLSAAEVEQIEAQASAYLQQGLAFLRWNKARRALTPAQRRERGLEGISADSEDVDAGEVLIDFYLLDIGDYCQVVRVTGTPPSELGVDASAFRAWLRNGRAVSHVEVAGVNLEATDLVPIMDAFLSRMDARTAHYGGL